MKLRNLILGIVAGATLIACGSSEQKATTDATDAVETAYTVDAANSTVNWKGQMVGMYSHNGTVAIKEGTISAKGNALTGGTFVVDLKTINPLDSNYSAEHPREGLIGHLSAPDFFASDSFPTATFVIKSVEANTATGDLTVRGKTNEEKVTDIVVTADSLGVNATGKLVFNRQKYGVAWKATMKDMVLSDDIELNITLQGKK